jgi:hypothetical protein
VEAEGLEAGLNGKPGEKDQVRVDAKKQQSGNDDRRQYWREQQ